MRIQVEKVRVQGGDAIGLGFGTTDDGTVEVVFFGPAVVMEMIEESIIAGNEVVADFPDWAVLATCEKP